MICFREHLTLADVGCVELGGQRHLDRGEIEHQAFWLEPVAKRALAVASRAEQGQVRVRGIARDEAQTLPERKGEMLLDPDEEEMIVEQRGAGRQTGEERVKFRLDFRRVSAEQAGEQARKPERSGSGAGIFFHPGLDKTYREKRKVENAATTGR